MPRSVLTPREQLIRIQRSIVQRLRHEILNSFEDSGPELKSYQKEYERSLQGGYRGVIPRREFLSRLASSDIIFQGDYHTLRECQVTALRLLRELSSRRPVALALEVVPVEGQKALDAYLAGELSEASLLEAIDYERNWGFHWNHYRLLFEFARANGVQIYGINTPSAAGGENLRLRDRRAAAVIARAAVAHPEAIVYVVAGDFHVCRSHLPRAVTLELRRERLSRRQVILHQNVDSFYWELARREMEHRAQFLELGPGEYCVMNSTPLVKYQSYLHWQLGQEEFREAGRSAGGWGSSSTVAEEVHRLVRTIARFLGFREAGLDDFVVYTTSDLDFLGELERRGTFSPREILEIKRQILNDESYFISRGNIIYLSSLSIDHAAEEAAHYLNNKLSGHVPRPLPMRTDFYSRILKEALGFLGSKIINPLRHHHGEPEFREILSCVPGGRGDASRGPLILLARLVLQHLKAERRCRRGAQRPRLRSIYRQSLDLHLGITHSLGYILGDKLYRGLVTGALERSEARRLFCLPLSGGDDAEAAYFDLVRRL